MSMLYDVRAVLWCEKDRAAGNPPHFAATLLLIIVSFDVNEGQGAFDLSERGALFSLFGLFLSPTLQQ